MRKGLIVFAAIVIGSYVVVGVLQNIYKDAQWPGIIAAVSMFVGAYIANRISGGTGNPFRGLVWGGAGMMFLVWIMGILIGACVMLASLGLQLIQWDPDMTSFIQTMVDASKDTNRPITPDAIPIIKGFSSVGLYTTPIIGSWFMAAVICLTTFPLYGWFARRIMTSGRQAVFGALIGFSVLGGLAMGGTENPMFGAWNEINTVLRYALIVLMAMSPIPAMYWLFLKSRSAVIPALANASYVSVLNGSFAFTVYGNAALGPPQGLIVSLAALAVGVALWVWKDPGGDDLAVAAVAPDGTLLTPKTAESLEAHPDLPGSPVAAAPPVAPNEPDSPDSGSG